MRVADVGITGELDGHFSLYRQAGSGAQSNMNLNGAPSNRAVRLFGGYQVTDPSQRRRQSSNDAFAMHIAAALELEEHPPPCAEARAD